MFIRLLLRSSNLKHFIPSHSVLIVCPLLIEHVVSHKILFGLALVKINLSWALKTRFLYFFVNQDSCQIDWLRSGRPVFDYW